MIRLAYITTTGMSAKYLLAGQLGHLQSRGFDVTLFCPGGENLEEVIKREGVRGHAIPFAREISPIQDLISLMRLLPALRRLQPHIVTAGTPKAALLGMIASFLVRVPVRIYVLRGLRAETARGLKRRVVESTERLTSLLAHRVIAVSNSLRSTYVRRGLCPAAKIVVLGDGSSNGVDVVRFRRDRDAGSRLRRDVGIGDDDPVVGFVGRLTRDKGIHDLVEAFNRVRDVVPSARLVVIGDAEQGDPVGRETELQIRDHPAIISVPHVPDIAGWYSAIDVLALPSSREGFPNVVLEAAAAGVPAVGYEVTGTVDAIEHGRTGMLVPAGDVEQLAAAMIGYLSDPSLRRTHGEAARNRVEALFVRERIWKLLAEQYHHELEKRSDRLA